MERPFNLLFIGEVLPRLLPFVGVTLYVTLSTIIAGSILAFFVTWAKLSRVRFLRFIAHGYTWILRCTPSIVLLFLVYYGLPKLLLSFFSININFWHQSFFVITTFTLFFSATMSEVFRSSYLSVDKGQYEAALSAGLSSTQANMRIVFPQAALSVLPNFGNSIISLMKEGALAYIIGIIDLMGQGMLIVARNYGAWALETYIALALIYWILTIIIEKSFFLLERFFAHGKRGVV